MGGEGARGCLHGLGRSAARGSGHDNLHPKREIPLTIAGRGKTILGLAARYADRWNTFGGFGKTLEEALPLARADNERLDELCAETGRTVLRSILLGYPFIAQKLWESDDVLAEAVGAWAEAGFEEIIVYYPPEWMPGRSRRRVRARVAGHAEGVLRRTRVAGAGAGRRRLDGGAQGVEVPAGPAPERKGVATPASKSRA